MEVSTASTTVDTTTQNTAPVQTGGKSRKTKKTTSKKTTSKKTTSKKTSTKKTATQKATKSTEVKVKTVGSRRDVWNGRAKKTSGGLTKADLILNSSGKPVSKAQHEKGIKQFPVLKPWRDHLNAFRVAHPELSLKEQMKGASKTYKKKKKTKTAAGTGKKAKKVKASSKSKSNNKKVKKTKK